jgi:hypothetical protein
LTEQQWLTAAGPEVLLDYLGGAATPRKLRLYACAWGRRLWRKMADGRSRSAVLTAERFADGAATMAELAAAHAAGVEARRAARRRCGRGRSDLRQLGAAAAEAAADVAACAADPNWGAGGAQRAVYGPEHRQRVAGRWALAEAVRDLFGNPFRPVAIDPRWLTSTVVDLARALYEGFTQQAGGQLGMAIIADALMDAGCDAEELLNHCRGDDPHARGCWAVDLLLGKR